MSRQQSKTHHRCHSHNFCPRFGIVVKAERVSTSDSLTLDSHLSYHVLIVPSSRPMLLSSTVNIVFYALIILFILLAFIMCIVVCIAMFISRKTIKKHRTDYLLLANSYIALFIAAPVFFDLGAHSIYGHVHPQSSFDTFSCRFKSYLIYFLGYVYFYSFFLQSIYRYCRIVYHTRIQLQSFRLYVLLSLSIWINGVWQVLPSLLLGHIDYVPDEFHCQLPANNLWSSLIGLSIMFVIPYLLTLVCYACTMYHVRQRTAELSHVNQQARLRRDLLILQRIVLLLTAVIMVAMPHVIIPIVYTVFRYIPSWASSFEWMTTVLALASASFIQIFVSPFMRQLFKRSRTQ